MPIFGQFQQLANFAIIVGEFPERSVSVAEVFQAHPRPYLALTSQELQY